MPLHFTTDFFLLIGGVCSKNIFEFFPHGCNSLNNRFVVNPFLPCILTNPYSTEHDNIKYLKLNGAKGLSEVFDSHFRQSHFNVVGRISQPSRRFHIVFRQSIQ